MKIQKEIEIIKQLTKSTDEQIKINELGWTSRVYLIDGGRIVFKFPKNKKYRDELKHEIQVFKLLERHSFNLKIPIINWCGANNEYAGFLGVLGESLKPEIIKSLDNKQKKTLGLQLGTFLNKLHSIEGFNHPIGTQQDEINEFIEKYHKNRKFFEQHFNAAEMALIDKLFLKTAPNRIKELGEDLVFCHGDFGYNNILLDSDLTAGVIDFGDAGLWDRSKDFIGFDDEIVLNAALEAYGNYKNLREKIMIWQQILPIFLMLFYIDRKDKEGIKQCADKIRRLIYREK